MVEALLWAILVLVMISAGINMKIYIRQERKDAEKRLDAECETAMAASAKTGESEEAKAAKAEEEADQSRKMDEYVQNIMSYQVSLGHGKKTGGEP